MIRPGAQESSELQRTAAHATPGDRVCIVLLSGIGDVVHGLPVAVALKRDRPSRKIIWVAEAVPAQVLEHHPAVDQVIVFRPERGLRGVYDLWNTFRAGPSCDLTLNMQRYAKSIFPAYLSGAPVRVGLAPSRTRDGVRLVNTEYTGGGEWRHTQDLFLEFLVCLWCVERPDPLEWEITLSEDEESAAETFFFTLGRCDGGRVGIGHRQPGKRLADQPVRVARSRSGGRVRIRRASVGGARGGGASHRASHHARRRGRREVGAVRFGTAIDLEHPRV